MHQQLLSGMFLTGPAIFEFSGAASDGLTEWSTHCLQSLNAAKVPGFESRSKNVRKLPVT